MAIINNTPRFLFAENPMADKKSGIHREFIIHTKHPRYLARVMEFDDDARDFLKENKKPGIFAITRKFEGTEYYIKVIQLYSSELIDDEFVEVLEKSIQRCGDWYFAFLKFEKGNYD